MRKYLSILPLALAVSSCVAQTKLSTPVIILPPANRSTGGTFEVQDSTSQQFVGLRSVTNLPTIVISSATAANPMVLTFATAPVVTTGSVIVIQGATGTGCSIMNGPQSVTIASGTSVTINLNGTGCTYAGSSASASTAYWYLPSADATNALCGNDNSTLTFGCTQITVTGVGSTAVVITSIGEAIDNISGNTVLQLLGGTSGGTINVLNGAGSANIDTIDFNGITTSGIITATSTGSSSSVITGIGAAFHNTSGNTVVQILNGISGGSINVLNGAGSSNIDTIDYTGITTSGTLTLSAMTGTSCLEEISGVVTATGSPCGGGGGGAWTSFTTSSTSMTISSQDAKYSCTGKTCNVRIAVTGTFTGTSGNYIDLQLPFAMQGAGDVQTFAGYSKNSLSSFGVSSEVLGVTGTTVIIGQTSGYANGLIYLLIVQGVYETT